MRALQENVERRIKNHRIGKRRKRWKRYNWTLNYVNCIFKHFIDDIISFFYFRVLFLCFVCIRFAHIFAYFCGASAFQRYIGFVIRHSAQNIANCEASENFVDFHVSFQGTLWNA